MLLRFPLYVAFIVSAAAYLARVNSGARRRFTSKLLSEGPTGSDLDKFNDAQFALMRQYQTGNFIGIQTGYDPENVEVEDFMYCEASMIINDEGNEIKHTNSFVVGEIRADCEVCFDSQRVKSREVGKYSKGKLRSRLCSNVELRGPGLTPRGLSTEFAFRHNDGRVRILLAHSPLDFVEVEGIGSVLSAVKLTDIVVVRERLNKRPLKLDENPDAMWIPTPDSSFEGNFCGVRERFVSSGDVLQETLPVGSLPALPVGDDFEDDSASSQSGHYSSNGAEDKSDVDYGNPYKRVLPGGIMVECPWTIIAGVPSYLRLSWKPLDYLASPGEDKDRDLVYAAQIEFTAFDDMVKLPDGGYRPSIPRVRNFFVDTLRQQ